MMRSFWGKVKFRRNERGQVLIWVLLLLILGSILLGPLLQLMNTNLISSHVYTNMMQRFYAADAGIEDAAYKIRNDDPKLPVSGTYNYTIEDVNGYQVNVTIEDLWILEGFESWHGHPAFPHRDLAVVGQIITQPTTRLNGNVTDNITTIRVVSTVGFPLNGTICIDNELITYTDKTDSQFTGCDRGAGGTKAASHSNGAIVYGQGTMRIDIIWASSAQLKINRIGVWLPAGFSYVNGSSAGIPASINYSFGDGSDPNDIIDAAAIEDAGGVYGDDPPINSSRGGTILRWNSGSPAGIKFEDMDTLPPLGVGEGIQYSDTDLPLRRSMSFQYTPSPAGQPTGSFSWIRTTRHDILLSWDAESATYKITSTAQEPDGGPQTTLESYIAKSRVEQVFGDYRAIGNSLMIASGHGFRDILLTQSSANVSDIPADATVEFAYLYWSAWWKTNDADTEVTFRAQDAAGVELFDGTVTADRWQIVENAPDKPGTYSYACFADVTGLVETETSGTVTLSNTTGEAETESVTITWNGSSGNWGEVKITADGDNPDSPMTVDGVTIEPGEKVTRTLDSDNPSVVLTSGSTPGYYYATIKYKKTSQAGSWVEVDGTTLYKDDSTTVQLETSEEAGGEVSEEVTITRNPDEQGVKATVNITAASDNPGDLKVDSQTIGPGGNVTLELGDGNPTYTLTLSEVDKEPCTATISCTAGKVLVAGDTHPFILSAEEAAFTGNGNYTVGGVQGVTNNDWSYAGWSLIITYSSPSESAHQLYLYQDFLYAREDACIVYPPLVGFQVPELGPEDEGGRLTVFVGEGDENYTGDYIEFNPPWRSPDGMNDCEDEYNNPDHFLPHENDPYDYDGVNPQNNVWNARSSGLGGESIDGIDIDTFDITPFITEGDTSALIELSTDDDSWNLVYIILSIRTERAGLSPVSFTTFTYQ